VLLVAVTVSVTLAVVFTKTEPVENVFDPSKVACAVVENGGEPISGSLVNTGNSKDNVKIQNNVSVYTGVICEDDVFLGPSMVFTNVINPRSHVSRKNEYKQTIVRKGASIGANATIVCGNEIGEYALIGAGSVVTKNVKPYALMVGNPARQIGRVSENGQKLEFDENGIAICTETKQSYHLKNNIVKKIV
jgi:UDP-2-acetamido-3-amino-2,3-dideoxy-glucuronate N-acetyltransferase